MGADYFENYAIGKTPAEAFTSVVTEARWEHGNGGYTGTIAEKPWFTHFTLPPRILAAKVISMLHDSLYAQGGYSKDDTKRAQRSLAWLTKHFGVATTHTMINMFDDKWGNALCFEVTGKRKADYLLRHGELKRGDKLWVFFGHASS